VVRGQESDPTTFFLRRVARRRPLLEKTLMKKGRTLALLASGEPAGDYRHRHRNRDRDRTTTATATAPPPQPRPRPHQHRHRDRTTTATATAPPPRPSRALPFPCSQRARSPPAPCSRPDGWMGCTFGGWLARGVAVARTQVRPAASIPCEGGAATRRSRRRGWGGRGAVRSREGADERVPPVHAPVTHRAGPDSTPSPTPSPR
jgi:hypothetical protein